MSEPRPLHLRAGCGVLRLMIGTQLVKILVIDDHEVVRRGVKQILEESFLYVEVGEADTSQKGIAAVQQEPWDLAIVDISLPDQSGLELLCELHSTAPRLPLMVLSLHPEEQYAVRAFRAGRDGLSHQTDCTRRVGQSRQASPDRPHVCHRLPRRVYGRQPEQESHSIRAITHCLSENSKSLCLLAQGRSVKHIAQSLTLSIKTVSTYRARLLDKLQLRTTAELIRYALDHHLVE